MENFDFGAIEPDMRDEEITRMKAEVERKNKILRQRFDTIVDGDKKIADLRKEVERLKAKVEE